MRRSMALLLLFVWVVFALDRPSTEAQGPFTADEQAAVAEIRAAIQQHHALPGYTAFISQKVEQSYFETSAGRTYRLRQSGTTEGVLEFTVIPGSRYHDQQLDLMRAVQSTVQGQTVGDGDVIHLQIQASQDRVSVRVEAPPALQALYPSDWVDLPADASRWPGLAFLDPDWLTAYRSVINPAYLQAPYEDVRSVEILEPAVDEGRTVDRYGLDLDSRLVRDAFGAKSLAGMFSLNAPFDLSGYMDLIVADESTRYTAEFSIFADDHSLYSFTERVQADVDIPEEYAVNSALPAAEQRVILDLVETQVFEEAGTER